MPRTTKKLMKVMVPLTAAALFMTGCSATTTPETPTATSDATLRVNFGQFPENWSPGQEMEGGTLRIPYETLLVPGTDGPAAGLATDWELTPEALTLTLREGVKFHDGTDFDAEAVKANVEFVRDGATNYSGSLQVVTSVDVVDATTVTLNLASPTPSLPVTLTSRILPIGSPAAIADGSIATAPVGTSPWAYDEAASIVGTRMVFSEFDEYWGEKPGFANVELVSITDPEASAAALLSGEIDVTDSEMVVFPRFEGSDIKTLAYPAIRNNLFFFDRGPGGVFEKKELRQAICYAINVPQFAELDGEFETSTQHFVEGDQGFSADLEGYTHDEAEAKALYAAAGSPTVNVEMVGAPYNARQIEIYMEQVRSTLGNVNVTVTQLPPPQYNSEWNSGKYPMGLSASDQATIFEWYSAWFAAGAPGNPGGLESAELKSAADAAIAAGTGDEADALWAKVTDQISAEALTCAHARSLEQLAYNSATVAGVAAPAEPWEPKSVNFRDLTPAK